MKLCIELFNEEEEKYHKFLANEEEIEEKIQPLERFLDIAEKNGEVSEIANKLAKILPLVEKSHDLQSPRQMGKEKRTTGKCDFNGRKKTSSIKRISTDDKKLCGSLC